MTLMFWDQNSDLSTAEDNLTFLTTKAGVHSRTNEENDLGSHCVVPIQRCCFNYQYFTTQCKFIRLDWTIKNCDKSFLYDNLFMNEM